MLPLVRDFLHGLFLCRSHMFCFCIAPSKLFHLSMKNYVWKQRGKWKRRPAICNFHHFFLARGIPTLWETETWTLPNARYEKLGLIVCLEYIGGIIKETGERYEVRFMNSRQWCGWNLRISRTWIPRWWLGIHFPPPLDLFFIGGEIIWWSFMKIHICFFIFNHS